MKPIPVIILNGFLGAGKTTLLKSLLVQAHKSQMSVSVIVNDMSELDVDGVLVANTEIVSSAHNNFVSITADSISSLSGIEKLHNALNHLLEHGQPELILIETSGSSHPLPLVKYLRDHRRVYLKAFLSLVDTVMLNDDYGGGTKLIPLFQEQLRNGSRSVENLLAEQIMFCNNLLLTKNDRLPFYVVADVAKAIHPLNPHVTVTAVPWGNLQLDELLAMPDYDFHRVALLIDELQEVIRTEQTETPTENKKIVWRVVEDDRPFHPQRLWETYHRFMGMGVYRSKGFFWLPGRDDLALLWNQAAGSITLEFISYWKAGVLEHADNKLTREERSALRQQVEKVSGRFGDRHCRLTVIGEASEIDDFLLALQLCFLTEDEITGWQNGATFPDPWPQKVSRLA
ncbi:cobalamin biosynthesis protein CobW [Kosakonia radicincitans]|uniref:CobW family GTP-binding protein n=1 Tax=Kosakonia radicincitans TaxID=283686 RepID=UPI0011ECD238|nr:GTP-binding protein [Kosakonia radicincitans]QEM91002.1 cobalamin biosynthesis protein CobW [Kosakonia radicincitans]